MVINAVESIPQLPHWFKESARIFPAWFLVIRDGPPGSKRFQTQPA